MSSLAPPLELPVTPYRVRGRLYLGTRAYFEACVPGGFAALLGVLRAPLRAFMEQPFQAHELYEVMVVPELIDAEARAVGLSIPRYLDQRSRFQAEHDLAGLVARAVLRMMPPSWVVTSLARAMVRTFNFGEPTVVTSGPCHQQVNIRGVPSLLCSWLEHSIAVYGRAGLAAAGVDDAELRSLPPVRVPHAPTVELRVDVQWNSGRGARDSGG